MVFQQQQCSHLWEHERRIVPVNPWGKSPSSRSEPTQSKAQAEASSSPSMADDG